MPRILARLVDAPATRTVLVVLALLFTTWVSMAAVFGPDTLVNPTFGSVYVLLWVGLVPAGAALRADLPPLQPAAMASPWRQQGREHRFHSAV